MKSLEYVKSHVAEFEEDDFIDQRWTKRFVDFLPVSEWENYGFKFTGEHEPPVVEWTEENILKQLKRDVEFGWEQAIHERWISSELMAMVVRGWCKVLENGLAISGDDGWYHKDQFEIVADHYGWTLQG